MSAIHTYGTDALWPGMGWFGEGNTKIKPVLTVRVRWRFYVSCERAPCFFFNQIFASRFSRVPFNPDKRSPNGVQTRDVVHSGRRAVSFCTRVSSRQYFPIPSPLPFARICRRALAAQRHTRPQPPSAPTLRTELISFGRHSY